VCKDKRSEIIIERNERKKQRMINVHCIEVLRESVQLYRTKIVGFVIKVIQIDFPIALSKFGFMGTRGDAFHI